MTGFYAEGLDALRAKNFDAAEKKFTRAIARPDHIGEAYFYLGVIACVRRDATKATEFLNKYATHQPVGDDFYPTFGTVIAALGKLGDDVRATLRFNRMLPVQIEIRTTAVAEDVSTEPWHFSPSKMNLFPRKVSDFQDLPKLVENYVLPGHIPPKPLFTRQTKLLTVGSCFADELNKYLAEQGIASGWMCLPPGLNNTFSLRQFIEWVVTGEQSTDAYWYDESNGGAIKWKPEDQRGAYLQSMKSAGGFVFTLGLAEVWQDTETKGTFWRGVPKSVYDPEKHICRMSTVEENVDNLKRIVELVGLTSPGVQTIFTLSPVPLRATFEDRSCIAADSVSKSILRVAIDQVMGEKLPNVAYWPSFEIVRWLGSHLPMPTFGDDGNPRHPTRAAVKLIIDAFMRHYFTA